MMAARGSFSTFLSRLISRGPWGQFAEHLEEKSGHLKSTKLCVFNKTSAHLETAASMMLFPTLNECFLGLNPDLTQHKHSVVTKLKEKMVSFNMSTMQKCPIFILVIGCFCFPSPLLIIYNFRPNTENTVFAPPSDLPSEESHCSCPATRSCH